jgi:hypothetical protein
MKRMQTEEKLSSLNKWVNLSPKKFYDIVQTEALFGNFI